jgi:ubiquinone biosynthesis protein COQ4
MDCPAKIEPNPRKHADWPRAFRAIRRMQLDPERTDQVFELNVALDGGDAERRFQQFRALPGGPSLLEEAPVLLDSLSDFEALRRLEPGSLGRAYLHLMESNGYSADGLRSAAAEIEEFATLHPGVERTWFAQRENCVHDLHHTVTGYGQDAAGETALLAFIDGLYCQTFRVRVVRFGMIASLVSSPPASFPRTLAFCIKARRRGAKARIASDYRWEEKLGDPLTSVRRELRIESLRRVHPRGVLQGDTIRWDVAPVESERMASKTCAVP